MPKDRKQIVVTEISCQVNKSRLIEAVRLWGGKLVAMPTAIPLDPLTSAMITLNTKNLVNREGG
jgi:hypothetical protein